MQSARFVRLAEETEVVSEHLRPPVALAAPGGIQTQKLGYSAAALRGQPEIEQVGRDELMVRMMPPRSLMRPLSEAALAVVLMLLFLGAVTDIMERRTADEPINIAVPLTNLAVGLVGFQAVRQSSLVILLLYALLTTALLAAGILGLHDLLMHAAVHIAGLVVALLIAQSMRPLKFRV